MKNSQKLLLGAQMAGIAMAQFMPKEIFDPSTELLLNDTEALDFLFTYDPTRPHQFDGPQTNPITNVTEEISYDENYLSRICMPRINTGEAAAAVDTTAMDAMTDEEYETHIKSFQFPLENARGGFSGSQYPCERLLWIPADCGVDMMPGPDGSKIDSGKTIADQNKCLCDSDYWAAYAACTSCKLFHSGDEAMAEQRDSIPPMVSEAVCGGSVTAALLDYWNSEYPFPIFSTVISDGAPGQTDVDLYYTGGVDFIAATIMEPGFTRTVDGNLVVMTPGPQAPRATVTSTASATVTPGAGSGAGPATPGVASPTAGSGSNPAGPAAPAFTGGAAANARAPVAVIAGVLGGLLMI